MSPEQNPETRSRGRGSAPRRKRVVLADRHRTRRVARTIMELEEQTSVGEVMIRHLVRVQLRTALLLAGLMLLALLSLPVLFLEIPALREGELFGISVPWLLLGVLPYPFLVLLGYLGTRSAERHEREFLHMVEQ